MQPEMSVCGHCCVECRVDLLERAPGGVIVRGPLCPTCSQEIEVEIDAESHEEGCDCMYHRDQREELERASRAREARVHGGLSVVGLEMLGSDFLAELDGGGQ